MIFGEQFGSDFQEGDQDARAEPPKEIDTFLIQTVNECGKFRGRADFWSFGQIPVTGDGNSAERGVQEMGSYVLHLPFG